MSCPVDSLIEICVVEYNVWALSTKLKGDILEVALGGGLHDLSADEGRTGEGNLVDTMVLGDGLTNSISVSNNKVEDTRREASFTDHVGDHEGGQRSHLGGFHDDDISGGESRADLPAPHQNYGGDEGQTTGLMRGGHERTVRGKFQGMI